jgi:hypothetical protein
MGELDMKKIALVPLVLVLAATAACSRSTDTPINSSGSAEASETVELAAGGLTTGSRGLHHSNLIQFGAPRATVVSQLTDILGSPTGTGRNAECPSGPVDFVNFGALGLHFGGGRFTGWVIDEAGEPRLESYHGLKIGDRRDALDADADIEVDANSSLGTELSFNGIGVLLSGPRPSDRVTTLFSGTTCFAR